MKVNPIQPQVNSFPLSFISCVSHPLSLYPTVNRNGTTPQNWLNLWNPCRHKETNVCLRLSPTQAKCLNPIDLPSEWWVCFPLRWTNSTRCSPTPTSTGTPDSPSNTPQQQHRHSSLVLWKVIISASIPTQGSTGKGGNWHHVGGPPSDPLLFSILSLRALTAGLHYLWQDSPWKPKLRPSSPAAFLVFCSLPWEPSKEHLEKGSLPCMKEWNF